MHLIQHYQFGFNGNYLDVSSKLLIVAEESAYLPLELALKIFNALFLKTVYYKNVFSSSSLACPKNKLLAVLDLSTALLVKSCKDGTAITSNSVSFLKTLNMK